MREVSVYVNTYDIGSETWIPGFRRSIVVLPVVECVATIAYRYTLSALRDKYEYVAGVGDADISMRLVSHGYGCTHIGPEKILVEESLLLLLLNPNIAGIIVFELGCGAFDFRRKAEFIAHVRRDTPVIYVRIQPYSYPSLHSLLVTCNIDGRGCRVEKTPYDKLYELYRDALYKLIDIVASKKRIRKKIAEVLEKTRIGVINGASNPSSIIANKTIGDFMEYMIRKHDILAVEGQFSELVPDKIMRLVAGNKEYVEKLIEMFKRSLTFKQAPEQPEPTPGNIRGGIPTLEVKQVMTTLRVPFNEGIADPSINVRILSLEDMLRYGRRLVSAIEKEEYAKASRIYAELLGLEKLRRGLLLVESAGYDPMTGNILAGLGVQAIYFTTGLGTPWSSMVPTIKVTADIHAWKRYGGSDGFIDYYVDQSRGREKIFNDLYNILVDTINGEKLRGEKLQVMEILGDGETRIGIETYNLTLQQLYIRA